ncbi:transmembrane protein 176B-like isoform X2 [Lissotriton helveticus]
MSSNIACVNGVEVASDSCKPTVINININQPSGLATLLKAVKAAWQGQKTLSQDAGKTPATSVRGEQKVLGAVQIMIGLLCVFSAVVSCFIQNGPVFYTGSGFWTGVPFILAGAVSIIAEKRGSPCWMSAAWLMNLASLAVAIAGIVMIANDFRSARYLWSPSYFCDGYDGSEDQTMDECAAAFSKLSSVLAGVRILLLVVTLLAICIALWSMSYGCKTHCCNLVSQQEEDVVTVGNDKEQLLASKPLQSPENHPKVETV